ncbi:hypothetical protein M0804_014809 [Polistes exclamans]|nr:hypothetical protein M0804_014810 [Polistes exclamans]KAI4474522.1 hypothetical protein M0804_014809 [Polistes exclamans]
MTGNEKEGWLVGRFLVVVIIVVIVVVVVVVVVDALRESEQTLVTHACIENRLVDLTILSRCPPTPLYPY